MSPDKTSQQDDMISIEINGVALQGNRGDMIIRVADEAGIVIPRFCYHKKLPIAANCRMCMVEVEGVPKPLPACATPINEGMKVQTKSPLAIRAQRGVMEFLLINHPLDCPICDQGGECELQDVAMGYGRGLSRFTESKRVVRDKDIGPLIATEMTRCIHCTRCIRTLEEVGGVTELGATGRGMHTTIGTFIEMSVDSEMSGNVIDVCPVGALTSKPFRFSARAWELRSHDSIAPHDCVGSNISVHIQRNKVLRVVPKDNEEVNECWISDRDRYSYEGLNNADRLKSPMIKVNGRWQETDWDTALDTVVEGVNEIRINQGDEQVGALVSASSTLEEMYLLQKLMRGMGIYNIDHRLRQSDFSDQDSAPVYPWLGQDIADLESLNAVLLVGANVRKDQPIVAHRLRKACHRGAQLFVVNGVDYPFAFDASESFINGPAGQLTDLAGILQAAVEISGKSASPALDSLLSSATVSDAQRNTAQGLIDADSATVLLGTQSFIHPQSSVMRALAKSISAVTGATLGYLPEGGNSAGAWLAGVLPHRGVKGHELSHKGQHAGQMLSQGLKAWLLMNVEPELDCSDGPAAMKALSDAGFVVVMSSYRSEAMLEYADVLLPTSPFTETSGTFVNAEGRWQSFSGAVAPYGDTRPGWKLLRVLGNMFDIEGFEFMSSEEVLTECRLAIGDVTPDNSGEATAIAAPGSDGELMRISDVSLYNIDGLVRRASSLQQSADAREADARMNAAQAQQLGLNGSKRILVKQGGDWLSLPLTVDDSIPDNCILVPAAVADSAGLGRLFGAIEVQLD